MQDLGREMGVRDLSTAGMIHPLEAEESTSVVHTVGEAFVSPRELMVVESAQGAFPRMHRALNAST